MRRKLIGAVVGVFLSAMPAAATVVQATFKGTVSFGTDMLGLWGVAGGDLAQKSADLTFLFDTALGTPVNGPYVRHGVWGGTLIGATTPVLSSTVKIGGVTISSDASYFGYAALLSDPTFGQSEQFQARGTATGSMGQSYTTQINAFFYGPGLNLPARLDTPYSLASLAAMAGQPNSHVYGNASFSFCPTVGNCFGSHPSFNWTSFSVAPIMTAAVPLPASGLLLLAAVGGAGAVRRQRKVA